MTVSGYRADQLAAAVRPLTLGRLWRIIPSDFAHAPLGSGTAPSRFAGPNSPYRLLYAAASVETAVCETLVRDRFTRPAVREVALAEVLDRSIATLSGGGVPRLLLDLRDGGALRIGAPTAVIGDRRQGAGRALGAALHALVPDAEGIVYPSRLTGEACVAVFDHAVSSFEVMDVEPLERRPELLPALGSFGIALVR